MNQVAEYLIGGIIIDKTGIIGNKKRKSEVIESNNVNTAVMEEGELIAKKEDELYKQEDNEQFFLEENRVVVPLYDKIAMEESSDGNAEKGNGTAGKCWNCGSTEHNYGQCTAVSDSFHLRESCSFNEHAIIFCFQILMGL